VAMGEVRIEQAEKKRSINRVVKGRVGKRKEKRKQNGKVTRRELLTKASDWQRLFPHLERALACLVQHHLIDFLTRR
jgi:hypothetical protein